MKAEWLEKEKRQWWIGRPPSLSHLEESYAQLTCGAREPKVGRVSQETFDYIKAGCVSRRYPADPVDDRFCALKFNRATLIVDPGVQTGYVKWEYEWEAPVNKEPKTVSELLDEEAKKLGREALEKILSQCSCQICRVMRMAERPFG